MPLLFLRAAEVHPVTDEELTADDEKDNDAGEYIRKRSIQAEGCGDLSRTAVQKYQKKAGKNHGKWIEMRHPADHNGCKAAPSGQSRRKRMVDSSYQNQSDHSADGTGEKQRADHDTLNFYSDISRRTLAFADDSDLISVLGEMEVYINRNCHYKA